MVQVRKKTWPSFFKEIREGKKWAEVRLCDFAIKPGDEMIFEEYDYDKLAYTGRTEIRKVERVHYFQPARFYPLKEIESKGMLLLEFERPLRGVGSPSKTCLKCDGLLELRKFESEFEPEVPIVEDYYCPRCQIRWEDWDATEGQGPLPKEASA